MWDGKIGGYFVECVLANLREDLLVVGGREKGRA
jgi:hypothetical protein